MPPQRELTVSAFPDAADIGNKEPEVKDPWCDPYRPVLITYEDVKKAAAQIKGGVVYTPCIKSHLSELTGIDIYIKKELLQYTGSFKERGACYTLSVMEPAQKRVGVISASLGNHAQALSYHGWRLGIPVTVVMPVVAPIMKVQKCRNYKANVVVQGKDMGEAKKIALQMGKQSGQIYINGYDHPHIMAGQGSVGLEIMEQIPDVDAVLVPVGGGGLIAGVAVAIKNVNPRVKVIGIEPSRCASYTRALREGRPTAVPVEPTLADGLAVTKVGVNAFETSKDIVDKIVCVNEEYLALAILRLIELEKVVTEGAGASGLAAIMSGQLPELKGKKVVMLASGGNIDTSILGRCLERGMAAEGRLIKVVVTVSDRPGGISDLCNCIHQVGVTIKDIIHERAWVMEDVFSVQVCVVCETRDYDHALELQEMLRSQYQGVMFVDFPKVNILTQVNNHVASSSAHFTRS